MENIEHMTQHVNNSRPLSVIHPGMVVKYHNENFSIISLLKREMTTKGVLLTFKVKEYPFILQGLSNMRVKLLSRNVVS